MKLLRPLHRQRTRKRQRLRVLNSDELVAHFGLASPESLATYLTERRLPYHRDSRGIIWASIEASKDPEGFS